MFIQKSSNSQTPFEGSFNAWETRLASIAAAACCLAALLCSAGCVSSGATAASSNAQGVEYFSEGQYDKAIAYFQESIEENPESAETYYNLGSAYQRKANQTGDLNLLTQAEDAYWHALQLEPAPETIVCCYRGIATSSTARGDSAGAMRTLEEWRDRNPDSIEPKLEIAYLLEAQDRDDDAYDALQAITEIAPNDYRAYYKMGTLSERAGDLDDAVEQTNVAAQLAPSNSEVLHRAQSLESQYAAKQRRLEREQEKEESEANSEPTLADNTEVVTQTAHVPATSAEFETPQLVLPADDAPAQPAAQPQIQPQTQPAAAPTAAPVQTSQAPQLGFGEVVVYSEGRAVEPYAVASRPASVSNSSGAKFVRKENDSRRVVTDGDVKWISSAVAQANESISQTSATIARKSQEAADKATAAARDLSNAANQAANAASETAQNVANAANQAVDTAKSTAQNVRTEATNAVNQAVDAARTTAQNVRTEAANAADAVAQSANQAISAVSPQRIYIPAPIVDEPPKNERTDLGSGFPRLRAGSIF